MFDGTLASAELKRIEILLSKTIRVCRWMHECCLCPQDIIDGQRYHDGGLGKRAHVGCVDNERGRLTAETVRVEL